MGYPTCKYGEPDRHEEPLQLGLELPNEMIPSSLEMKTSHKAAENLGDEPTCYVQGRLSGTGSEVKL